jgi:transposase-like protein
VIKELGLGDQTLRSWAKGQTGGIPRGAGSREVTPEEVEFSNLRAENLRLKRENEILKNGDRRRGMSCEVLWIPEQGFR